MGRRAAALKAGVVALIVVFILAVLASVAKGRRAAALRQVSSPSSCLILDRLVQIKSHNSSLSIVVFILAVLASVAKGRRAAALRADRQQMHRSLFGCSQPESAGDGQNAESPKPTPLFRFF